MERVARTARKRGIGNEKGRDGRGQRAGGKRPGRVKGEG